MLPAFVKALLFKLAAAIALLILISCMLLWPARHALLPFWPGPVYEVLSETQGGKVCHTLQAWHHEGPENCGRLIARDRPVSLLCMEFHDGSSRCGFLLGVRTDAGEGLNESIPEPLVASRVDPGEIESFLLVLSAPAKDRFEVSSSDIRRLFRPNVLSPQDRLLITWQRVSSVVGARLPVLEIKVVSGRSREER
jgi:hypothetical protein